MRKQPRQSASKELALLTCCDIAVSVRDRHGRGAVHRALGYYRTLSSVFRCAGIILRIWSEGRWQPPPQPRVLQGLAVLSAPVPAHLLHPVAALHVLTAIRRLAFLQHPRPLPPRLESGAGLAGAMGPPMGPPESPPAAEAGGDGPAEGTAQAAGDELAGPESVSESAAGGHGSPPGASAAGRPQGHPPGAGLAERCGARGVPPVDLAGRLDTLVQAAMKRESVSSRSEVQREKARKLWLLTSELARLHYHPRADHAAAMADAAGRLARYMHLNGVHAVMDTLRAWHARAPVAGAEAALQALAARATALNELRRGRAGAPCQNSRRAAREEQRAPQAGRAPEGLEAAA